MIPFVKDSLGNYTFILYLEKTNESIDLSFLIFLYTFVFIACLMRAIYEISKKKETAAKHIISADIVILNIEFGAD